MPEYLSPGVYVEEVDTGSKPIEGVSTSTAGLIGVTERGPVDVPILVTSVGEYERWFGGKLNRLDYSDGEDRHCYLPDAIEGFFANGGKRVYVTRVAPPEASRASTTLHGVNPDPSATPATTTLLSNAGRSTGTAVQPLVVLDGTNISLPGVAPGDSLRIGDGSASEYRRAAAASTAMTNSRILSLSEPIRSPMALGAQVDILGPAVATAYTAQILARAGSKNIQIQSAAAPPAGDVPINDAVLQIGFAHYLIRSVTPAGATGFDLALDRGLDTDATAGGVVKVLRTASSAGQLLLAVDSGALAIVLSNNAAVVVPALLRISDGPSRALCVADKPIRVTLTSPLPFDLAAGARVAPITLPDTGIALALTQAGLQGDSAVTMNSRQTMSVGQTIRVGSGSLTEFRRIRALPSTNPVGLDPGLVLTDFPLTNSHALGSGVSLVVRTPSNAAGTSLLASATAGSSSVSVVGSLAAGDIVEVTSPDGSQICVVVASAPVVIAPALIALDRALDRAHGTGSEVVERIPLLGVTALDTGIWGNRVRVSTEHQAVGLVAPTPVRELVDPTHFRLASAVGVEPGTILELSAIDGTATSPLLKVQSIDRQDNDKILLATALSAQQQAEVAAAGPNGAPTVRSLEFRLTVELLHQRDAARPRRNENVIATEVYRDLSMDPRHTRYVQRVIGDSDLTAPKRLFDRRTFGESRFIRVQDVDFADPPTAASMAIRIGPEALVDVLPATGTKRPARHGLSGGDDVITTMDDDAYIGLDNVVPELRTGLQSFRNIDAVSILGCPGRTSVKMQQALIDHCQELRYRFAVLDCDGPPNDTITDVQKQRQSFDTKYASLYYPWMMVPEVFPTNLDIAREEAIPPSGHMLGLYARVDVERGVHKAPANEVMRGGITNLRRTLNKSEHDILNPYPTNINVIRDFRRDNRGIRAYGARVMTSDPDWKYVNVRRLLIFVEKSIDIGLQWVVFEPNAEPLWARVNRSVSNFLTTVWRNGALEGTTRAEAFFVKCDRTTMTQTDIDNGRLIVEIGVAPVKPAEFVIVRIGLFTAHADD